MKPLAVIKLGSTSCVLLVAATLDNPIHYEHHMVNLIGADREEKLANILSQFTTTMNQLGISEYIAAGGEVLRKFPSLLELAKNWGFGLWNLSGSTEGELAWIGVTGQNSNVSVIVDIGGGSTEFITSRGGISVAVGVSDIQKLHHMVWPAVSTDGIPTFIGGTAVALAHVLESDYVERDAIGELLRNLPQTLNHPKMARLDPARRALMSNGLQVIQTILDRYHWSGFFVHHRGLTEGLWITGSLGRGARWHG